MGCERSSGESTLRRLIMSGTSRKAQIWRIISEGVERRELRFITVSS